MSKHPIQKPVLSEHGTLRYTQNDVVDGMVKVLSRLGYDLNDLHAEFHTADDADWDQFNQLIGYSLSGIPLRDESLYDISDKMYEEGKSEKDSRLEVLEETVSNLKKNLRKGVSELYGIHPEDLN